MARTAATFSSSIVSAKLCLPVLLVVLLSCFGVVQGLSCYKCGQYNDGVGSITPCINYTAIKLQECPKTSEYCIKYVSEGSTVRDCVPSCVEKEAWSTRTYCCKEDGCNSAPTFSSSGLWLLSGLLLVLLQQQVQQLQQRPQRG